MKRHINISAIFFVSVRILKYSSEFILTFTLVSTLEVQITHTSICIILSLVSTDVL